MEPDHLRLITHCPMCRASYQDAEVRFCNDLGTAKVYHCTCLTCAHALLVVVMENPSFSSSIGMVTDLSADDVRRLDRQTALTTDECVRFHDLLERESREFCLTLSKNNVA